MKPTEGKEGPQEQFLLVRTDGGPDVRKMTMDQILRLRILLPERLIEVAPRPSSEFESIRWQERPFSRTAWLISASGRAGLGPEAVIFSETAARRSRETTKSLRVTAAFAAVAAAFFAFVFFRPPAAPEAGEPMVTVTDGKLHIHNESDHTWVRPVIGIKSDSDWYEFAIPGRIQPDARVSIALPYFRAQQRPFPTAKEPRVVRLTTDNVPPLEIDLAPGQMAALPSASIAETAPSPEPSAHVPKPKPRVSPKSFFANSAALTE